VLRLRTGLRVHLLASGILLVCGTQLLGCANHVRYVDTESDHPTRELQRTQYRMRGAEGFVQSAELDLEFYAEQVFRVTREFRQVRTEQVTPFRGLNELVELPLGVVALPVACAAQLADLAFFGSVPDAWVAGRWRLALDALNPLMNLEDEQRLESRTLAQSEPSVRVSTEREEEPLAGETVYLSLAGPDGGFLHTFETDPEGHLRVDLLELLPDRLPAAPTRIGVELHRAEAEQADISELLYLDRVLGRRLMQVAPVLARTRHPKAPPEILADALYVLEQLGFRARAARLEEQVTYRFRESPSTLAAFEQRLQERYREPPAPLPSEAPAEPDLESSLERGASPALPEPPASR